MVSKKEELASKVGMQFEEAAELFSDETLNNMLMINVVGGASGDKSGCGFAKCTSCDKDYQFCNGAFCGNCSDSCAATTPTPTPSSTTPTPAG